MFRVVDFFYVQICASSKVTATVSEMTLCQVSEMFGDDQEGKNLKFQQGTFAPKGDPRSAREKKQDFLSSNVLPATSCATFSGGRW